MYIYICINGGIVNAESAPSSRPGRIGYGAGCRIFKTLRGCALALD